MPSAQKLEQDKLLGRLLGTVMRNRALWHLNRHSVAKGLAAGLWWAWIPIPAQTVGACGTAWKVRGNLPLAFAMCWVSNPLTMFPAIYICYKIGLLVTGQPGLPNFVETLKSIFAQAEAAGWWHGVKKLAHFGWENLGVLWPFWVGCVVFSSLNALAAYFGVHALWRWNLVRRWRKRGHHIRCRRCRHTLPDERAQECPNCGAWSPRRTRIGLGLASIARLARSRRSRLQAGSGA